MWEGWHRPGQDGKEVVLEHADGALCSIAVVDVWRDQLVGAVIGCDGGAGFVVKNVDGRQATIGGKMLVDVFEGGDAVGIMLGGNGVDKDHIGLCAHG